MAERKFTSETINHVCGKCYQIIKAGQPLVYMFREYHTPDGKKHIKHFPVHFECAKKEETQS